MDLRRLEPAPRSRAEMRCPARRRPVAAAPRPASARGSAQQPQLHIRASALRAL